MRKAVKALAVGAILSVVLSSTLFAEKQKKLTIEEMEIHLAVLEAEIAEEKVKLYQRESLLLEMKLELLKRKKEAKKQ